MRCFIKLFQVIFLVAITYIIICHCCSNEEAFAFSNYSKLREYSTSNNIVPSNTTESKIEKIKQRSPSQRSDNSDKSKSGFPEWVIAVISMIIGFFLTMCWDSYKSYRDTLKKDVLVLTSITEELLANVHVMFQNNIFLDEDIKALSDQKSLVQALVPLNDGLWDLIRMHLPNKISSSKTMLLIRDIIFLTRLMNSQIESRENYRNNNQAFSGINERLMHYNNTLKDLSGKLTNRINEFTLLLQKMQKQSATRTTP